MKNSTKYLLVVATILVALTACTKKQGEADNNPSPGPDPSTNKSLALVTYNNCDELETEIKEMLIGEMEKNVDNLRHSCRYNDDYWWARPQTEPTAGGAGDGEQAAGYTGTNLQEAGVDEADLIKTDGQYAYAILGEEIKIVRVWPFSEFGLVTTLRTQARPTGLYLTEGKLIVLSQSFDYGPVDAGCLYVDSAFNKCIAPPVQAFKTIEEVYDVSNPAQPTLIKQNIFSGEMLSSRRVGQQLYMILTDAGVNYPRLNYDLGITSEKLPQCPEEGEPTPTLEMLLAIEKLKQENREMIQSLTLAELLPGVGEGRELACTDLARSESAVGTKILMVYADSFAEANGAPSRKVILSNAGTAYASRDSIYVTAISSPYGWWGFSDYEFKDTTVIHRFALLEDALIYRGSVEVEGHLLDNGFAGSRYSSRFSMAQFALSEYAGYLRVATTRTEYGEGSVSLDNRVVVLQISDMALTKVGEVTGMGKGEKIHAVRFIGERAYMVTFKKTDPLYVVNLTDPAAPAVEGELHIPGFSTYLHPFDKGYLIGLGFAADDQGDFAWTQGLKIALFDVTNPSNPTEVGHREIGSRGSYSPAVEEHHAFTLDKERGLIALPVEIYEGGQGGSDYGEHSFSGVMLLGADLSGTFETAGQIVINSNVTDDDIIAPMPPVPMWDAHVLRTVIIGSGTDDGVLTLTPRQIQLNLIDTQMSEVGVVR